MCETFAASCLYTKIFTIRKENFPLAKNNFLKERKCTRKIRKCREREKSKPNPTYRSKKVRFREQPRTPTVCLPYAH